MTFYDRYHQSDLWKLTDILREENDRLNKENKDMREALTVMVSVIDGYTKDMDNWKGSAKEFAIEKYVNKSQKYGPNAHILPTTTELTLLAPIKLPKKGGSKRATKNLKKIRRKK